MCPRRFSASRKSPAVKYASLSSLIPQIPSSLLKRQEITVPASKIGGIVGKNGSTVPASFPSHA